jgi:DNA-binding XRE family transcriptional regulator
VHSAPTPDDWVFDRHRAVGEQIGTARLRANLTQEKLAELAGLDRQAVNRIEQGRASAKLDNLIRVSYDHRVGDGELTPARPSTARRSPRSRSGGGDHSVGSNPLALDGDLGGELVRVGVQAPSSCLGCGLATVVTRA